MQELAARLERLSAKTEAVEQARRDARRAEQEQRRQQQLWQQQSRLGAPPRGAGDTCIVSPNSCCTARVWQGRASGQPVPNVRMGSLVKRVSASQASN